LGSELFLVIIGFRGKEVNLKSRTAYDYVATRVFGEFALTNKKLGLVSPKN
jgi:hypothetical protein